MKKLFTLFFVLSLACSAFAGYYFDGTLVYEVYAAGTNRYAYVVNPREYPSSTLTSPITTYTGNIVIPDSICTNEECSGAYEVRYIKQGAFKNSNRVTSVSLPKYLLEIQDSAFYSNSFLTSITMRSGGVGLSKVGKHAFYNCNHMTVCNLYFNANAYIDKCAFYWCKELTSFDLTNIKEINDSAFVYCETLTSVTFDSNTFDGNIPDWCFCECSALKTVNYQGNKLFKIGENSFRYCTDLQTINANVSRIYAAGLSDCINLKSITLAQDAIIKNAALSGCIKLTEIKNFDKCGNTTLEGYEFTNCHSLKSLSLPSGLESIKQTSFFNCSGLKTLNVGLCTADLTGRYFTYCDSLESIIVHNNNTRYYGINGLIEKSTNTLVLGTTKGNLYDAKIQPGLITIETIGDSAFYGRNITEVTLPLTLRSINGYAFSNTKLKNIYIPNTVQNIGELAFYNTPLEKIILGKNVNIIGYNAFGNCSNLTSIVSTSINPCDVSFTADNKSNITVEVDYPYINTYKADPNWKDMNIVESDEYDNGFFYYLDNNEAIITTIDTIDSKCYYTTFPTDTIVFPEYIRYKGIDYPVTKIDYKSFYFSYPWMDRSKIIVFPSTMKEIGDYAFFYSKIKSVVLNNGIKRIGNLAFSLCDLQEINLPASITEIGEGAFAATSIKEITIPNKVQTIKDGTLSMCGKLKKVNIGKAVTNIEKGAFTYSPNIRTITCKSVTPAVFESTTFTDNFVAELKDSARLIVPEVALADYQNAPVWQEFLDIQGKTELNPTAVEEAVIENLWVENGTVHYDGEFRIYDVVGRDVTNLNGNLNGIYIIRTDKAVQKVSITK